MKECTVTFALPARQWAWRVRLPEEATIADALRAAREQSRDVEVPWETADVGIFGVLCDRAALPRDGDRIEIYRPLTSDPKESRRARAAARQVASDRASARAPKRPAKPAR